MTYVYGLLASAVVLGVGVAWVNPDTDWTVDGIARMVQILVPIAVMGFAASAWSSRSRQVGGTAAILAPIAILYSVNFVAGRLCGLVAVAGYLIAMFAMRVARPVPAQSAV